MKLMNSWKTRFFGALLAVTFLSVPAFAVNWIQIGSGHYIDADSVRPASTYGSYTMDTKYMGVNAPLEEINGSKVWTINTNSYIDCRSGYAKTLTYTALDQRNNVVTRGRNVQKQWMGIDTPGSRAYESYAFVCTDKYLMNRSGYNRFWYY